MVSPRRPATRSTSHINDPNTTSTEDSVDGGTQSDNVISSPVSKPIVSKPISFDPTHSDQPTSGEDRLDRIEKLQYTIIPTINAIQEDVNSIKVEQGKTIDNISTKVGDLEQGLDLIKSDNKSLREQNRVLNDKINRLESYSRMYNLLFHNVPEDQAPVENTVRRILTEMGIADVDRIMIDIVHRLGQVSPKRSRPVILRLVMRSDRNRIWESRYKLKGPKIILSEDFPEEYQRQRNLLRPVLSVAKSNGSKTSLIDNKIRVNGKLYGADQMTDLPLALNPELGCIHESKDNVCFFGRYTPLSNFYKCTFKVNGLTYNCIEQYLHV